MYLQKLPLLFLPWLSWSSVNGVILLVNTVVDVLIWVRKVILIRTSRNDMVSVLVLFSSVQQYESVYCIWIC